MLLQQPLFKKKNIIQVLNAYCVPGSEEISKNEQKIIEFIRKFFENEELTKDGNEFTLAIHRIREYLEGIYNLSQSIGRISEKQLNEQIERLKKVLTRETFSIREQGTKTELERDLYITRLKLKNWMMFEEKEIIFKRPQDKIDENASENKNIIVLHGENTSGKSNIFNAIKMAILGPKNFILSQEYSKKIQQNEFMRDFVARSAIKKALEQKLEKIEMEISLDFQITDKNNRSKTDTYNITRTWNVKISGELENTKIEVFGKDDKFTKIEQYGDGQKFENEDEFNKIFERFIPRTLQRLFITDKEILSKKIIEDPEKFIREIVQNASEYKSFDDIHTRLSDIHKKLKSDLSTFISSKLKDKNNESNDLKSKNKELKENLRKIQKYEKDIEENLCLINEYEFQTKDYKNDEYEKYNNLQKQVSEINKKIRSKQKEVHEIINSIYIPLSVSSIFTSKKFKEKFMNAKNKLKSAPPVSKYCKFKDFFEILEEIAKTKTCICGRAITDEIELEFYEQRRRTLILDNQMIYNEILLKLNDFGQNFKEEINKVEEHKKELANLLSESKGVKEELSTIDSASFNRNMNDLLKKIEELRKKNRDLEDKITDFKDIQNKQDKIQSNQNTIDLRISETNDPEIAQDKKKYGIQMDFIDLCKDINHSLQKKFDMVLIEHVVKMMTEYFKKIDWEGKFWRGFKMDENWKLMFVNESGQTIALASEAQKKIIMISFICALIDIRKIKIPWIIDNVLSDLSGENVRGIAQNACGNQDFPQQFFFFTEDEWNRIKSFLEGKILQKFVFNKLSSDSTELTEESV